ncbi:hypothetical protein [Paenibacillus apiarius]|uniref:hypothetical protein n=1 Tax=Paenibacillus apiarius TaxID=46240 RepID=UPI003B3A3081
MKKYLECIASGWDITVGKRYEVIREDDDDFVIIDDAKDDHIYTKEPDENGESYRDWFKLVEEAEDIENITVLTDELGLQREYHEVKRNANDGDTVIYKRSGRIAKCFSRPVVLPYETWTSTANGESDMYVLEPTDVIRINGERFREDDRKANVGERVIIVSNTTYHCFPIGSTATITKSPSNGLDRVRGDGEMGGWLDPENYRVLEPLGSAQQTQESEQAGVAALVRKSHEQQAQIDGLIETVANLARRVAEAETYLRVAREDIVLIEEGVSEDIRELKKEVGELRYGDSTEVMPEPVVDKPSTRDEIIEKAKADVAELSSRNHPPPRCSRWSVVFKRGRNIFHHSSM